MDRRGCVIYVNTFSHSLAPSMRMGYMVLPERLMEQYRQTLGFYSCSVPLFDQYVLARFISQGYFERHLNRLRRQNKGNNRGNLANSSGFLRVPCYCDNRNYYYV